MQICVLQGKIPFGSTLYHRTVIESYEGKLRSVLRREVGVLLKALTPAVLESDPNSLVRSRDKSPIDASGMEA